jgi:hypothetical protein
MHLELRFANIFFDHLQPIFDDSVIENIKHIGDKGHSCRTPLFIPIGVLPFALSC